MNIKLLVRGLVLVLGASVLSSQADDTDIYLNQTPPEGSEPYVMFSIDSRPSGNATICSNVNSSCAEADYFRSIGMTADLPESGALTAFHIYRLALKHVFKDLKGVKVGLMVNHDDGNCHGPTAVKCTNGGYILYGFETLLEEDDGTDPIKAKYRFDQKLKDILDPQGNISAKYQGKELFFEFFRYLTGQGIYNAHNGWKDYGTNDTYNLDQEEDGFSHISWDPTIEEVVEGVTTYKSPLIDANECAKIFTVNIMFGVSQQEDQSDTAVNSPLGTGGLGTSGEGFVRKTSTPTFPEVLRRLNTMDLADGTFGRAGNIGGRQNVTSYFLVPSPSTSEHAYANAGGTGSAIALGSNPAALIATLQSVFNQILSVSTTFVASSVPANVFNRAEIIDNVYIALFQVDANGKPRWPGNLKKLKVGADESGARTLVDATGAPAVEGDGRIGYNALTFWTNAGSLLPPDSDKGEIAGKDGRSVERGGAGQKIPGFIAGSASLANGSGTRQLFTEPGSGSTLMALNADTSTTSGLQPLLLPYLADGTTLDVDRIDALKAKFGLHPNTASNADVADRLIRFARGIDVGDDDADDSRTDSRLWVLGDPLHSRPLAINYGARAGYSVTNPDIRILMGTNDGFMHMFRNTTSAGADDGSETWAFMPRSALPALQRLALNDPGNPVHPYSVDGAPVAYVEDTNQDGTIQSGEKVWLFFGLRRGGRAYYALDITDPDNPRFMWSISNTTTGFGELGFTFSTPRVGKVRYSEGGTLQAAKPALIFSGGYDMNKDQRGVTPTDDTMGNAIYVADAQTGTLIWKANKGSEAATATAYQHTGLRDSIPSDVSAVDTNDDGYLDRVYVGDTGGVLWRADLPAGAERTSWKVTPMLSVGRHSSSIGAANDRRFFHRPDVVLSKDPSGAFDGVVIVSGDRPHPLGTAVENWAYMFKDRVTVSGSVGLPTAPYTASDLADVTDNCLQDDTAANCQLDLTHGWRMELERDGEKGLASPLTMSGTVFFTTYIPPDGYEEGTCGPSEGKGRLYAVALQDATATYQLSLGLVAPPDDPSALTELDRSMELASGGIPAEIVALPPDMILLPDLSVHETGLKTRWRTWWSESEQ